MAAACTSLMGSKKASRNIVALGLALVLLLGLSHLQESDAADTVTVVNLSLAPVKVTASVNATILGSVVAGASATVSLSLPATAGASVNLTITNLLNNASTTALVSLSTNPTLLITPVLLALGKINVLLVDIVGLVFNLIRIIASAL